MTSFPRRPQTNEGHGCTPEDGTGKGGDEEGDGPKIPTKSLTAEERKELQDEIKQAVLQAAQSAGNDVPADIKRMIKELTEPKLS